MRRSTVTGSLIVGVALLAGTATASAAPAASAAVGQSVIANELISVKPNGEPPEEWGSWAAAVDGSGRYVAFSSDARMVKDVKLGRHHKTHVYLRDRSTGSAVVVDARADGSPSNGFSGWPSVSADGRYVAFESNATNLTPGDDNGDNDIFVRDTLTGTTTTVSVAADGRPANNFSRSAVISADGTTVVFESWATNLVPGTPGPVPQAYRRDLTTGTTTLVSRTPSGAHPDGISDQATVSGDGNLIAYATIATDVAPGGGPRWDVVVFDVTTGLSKIISLSPDALGSNGDSLSPQISADGSVVAFASVATNLVPGDSNSQNDVFVAELATGSLTKVSRSRSGGPANGASFWPAVSYDGSRITFASEARNIAAFDDNGAADIFVADTASGLTELVSRAQDGTPAGGYSDVPSIAGDGSLVVYRSQASDIVPGTDLPNSSRIYAAHTE